MSGTPVTVPAQSALRYVVAILATIGAFWARSALSGWSGTELPPFITLYPVVMLVALLAGFGPGLVATSLGSFLSGNGTLLRIATQTSASTTVDAISLALFFTMGIFLSVAAEFHRRTRQKTAAYEKELALTESSDALREQREWLRVTLTSIGDAVLATDMSAKVTLLNPAAAMLTGWQEEQAIGRPVHEVVRIIDEETGIEGEDIVGRVLKEGTVLSHAAHCVLEGLDGRKIPIDDTAAPIRDNTGKVTGVVVVFHDVKERRRVEDAIRESEYVIRLIDDSLPDSAVYRYTLEPDGTPRFLYVSAGIEHLTGIKPDIVLRDAGALDRQILPEYLNQMAEGMTRSQRDLSVFEMEVQLRRSDGQLRWNHIRSRPHRLEGGRVVWDGVQTDITRRKRSEARLQKLNRTLRALTRSSQASVRFTDENSYMVEICRIIIEDCAHAMVWIGFAEDDAGKSVRPVAWSGFEEGYLETLKLTWADTERGRGPTGKAIRTGQVCLCRNMLTDPEFLPWREEAIRRGYASSIVLPLIGQGRTFGALTIYSRDPDPFSEDETSLLSELAGDLASRIDAFRLHRDRIQAQEHLRESQRRLSVILDSIADGFYALDREWRFTHINDAALAYFNRSRNDMLGRTLFDAFSGVRGSIFELNFRHAMVTGEPVHFETDSVVTDRTVEMHAYPSSDNLTVFFHDITQRKEGEQALRESEQRYKDLVESERAARSEAERANRIKDEFLANLSHELRTPLSAILGWTQMLQRSRDQTRIQKGLEIIERNTRIQTQLISDLLDMSRIISGKLRLNLRSCNLGAIAEAAMNALLPAAEAKGISIENAIEPFAAIVSGDPDRLQQTLWNLLSNAVKFTPSGGQVRVTVRRTDAKAEVVISDTGAGISREFLPFVFDRFRQGNSSAAKKHGGLGLGLAIVKHLVELHGGTVEAESPGEGQGATFTISLPVLRTRVQADTRPDIDLGSAIVSESIRLGGIRVLVVEDEADTRDLLTHLLQERGAQVLAVDRGSKALDVIQSCRPDALIGDIGMPEMDGYEMIRRIRQFPPEAGGDTPAIALTAFSRPEDRTQALLAGYQYHLAKPIEWPELFATLAVVTRRLHSRDRV
jgi:PAS domain S-box-containing protein